VNQPLNAKKSQNTHFFEEKKPSSVLTVRCISFYPKATNLEFPLQITNKLAFPLTPVCFLFVSNIPNMLCIYEFKFYNELKSYIVKE